MMPYHAYVLRFWPEIQEDTTVWRFALLDSQNGHRVSFDTLDALADHLEGLITLDVRTEKTPEERHPGSERPGA